ncbi:MAG TPA: 3-deoxy-manno-octulosonate cytidylyltransferase [Solirubrobacteraceae bacterium]
MTLATVVAIPARLQSSRLPRKVLADIAGRTMLRRTHDVALASQAGRVVVLTDAEEVAAEVRAFGGEVLLTDPELTSGTARIASVAERLQAEVVVNFQGDAPLTDPAIVAACAREHRAIGAAAVTMPVYRMHSSEDVQDPSVVKVVRAHDGRVLYCSRSPVPHVRDAPPPDWPSATSFWGHVGLYAYGAEFLRAFGALPPSPLEDTERLEQLRWLEAGLHLHTFEVSPQGPSVDTPGQLERVRAAFLARDAT